MQCLIWQEIKNFQMMFDFFQDTPKGQGFLKALQTSFPHLQKHNSGLVKVKILRDNYLFFGWHSLC